jgi:rhodanese-related sulfurtransferase
LDEDIDNLLIIDARYPFEYSGGHIKSAHNVYTETDLRLLFSKLITSSTHPSKIIFHCEFSSERGPRLCRLFRSLDRQYNLSNYPNLSFPSIYLLDGGYAEFYNHSLAKQYCQPNAYISMFEQQYRQELQIYRHAKKVDNGRIITKKLVEQQGPIQFCMS